MSKTKKFFGDAHPPGLDFDPTDEELVTLYLLPRVLGEADPFPGLIIEDDKAANTQPWILFPNHGLPVKEKVPAFFYVRAKEARPGARPSRVCDGGGTWKSQKSVGKNKDDSHVLLVGGEQIRWIRHNLNFDMGSGSIGWVMHEYYITDHPSLKVYRISFSGHGHKRTRVPDGYGNDSALAGEPATKRARVADIGSASWTTTTSLDQQDLGTAQPSGDQDPSQNIGVVAEMAQPSWEFQEHQVQIMEQPPSSAPRDNGAFSADQDPPMLNQDSSAGLELGPFEFEIPTTEEFVKMMECLADLPDIYPQSSEKAPASTMGQKADDQEDFMMPSFRRGVQDMGNMSVTA